MKLRELFSSESKWCKGASAKSESDRDTGPIDTDAAKWCLLGGFRKCYAIGDRTEVRARLDVAIGRNWGAWNDNKEVTFSDLKELLDRMDI